MKRKRKQWEMLPSYRKKRGRKRGSAFAALVLALVMLAGNLLPALADTGEAELFISEGETADLEMLQQNENSVAGSVELVGLNAGEGTEDFSSNPKEEPEKGIEHADTADHSQGEEVLVEFTDGTELSEPTESPEAETGTVPLDMPEKTEPAEGAEPAETPENPETEEILVSGTGENMEEPEDAAKSEESEPEMALFMTGEECEWLFSGGTDVGAREVDFTDMIQKVTIQHRENEWDSWKSVTEDTELKLHEQLRFELQYIVPAYTLSADKPTIVYQLPENFRIIQPSSGEVTNDHGNKRGTYQITSDGRIAITFEEKYVNLNQDGQQIEGFINFESDVSRIDRNNGTNTDISFNDRIHISIKTEEEIKETADLKVEKAASSIQKETGMITYTVTVSSEQGTGKEVTLQDVMTNVTLGGNLEVKNSQGAIVEVQQPLTGEAGFQITLPKMGPGETYTITYTGKLPDSLKNGTVLHNRVTASSEDQENGRIQDTAETTTHYETIKKEGAKNQDGTITWTITVNPGQENISGYILEDLLNGVEFKGPATCTDSYGTVENITFPYTFPEGSCDVYTITYNTKPDRPLGESSVKNKAVLKKNQTDNGDSSEYSVWIGDNNPLTKQGTGCEENNGGTVKLDWKVKIEAKNGGSLEPSWTYQDTPGTEQWFTEEQKIQLEETLKNVMDGKEYQVEFTPSGEEGKYSGYTITCQDSLQSGERIEFSYTTTAKLNNREEAQYFWNNGNVNQKYYSNGSNQYTPADPVIVKEDDLDGGKDQTAHEYGKLSNGSLRWKLKVTVPENKKGQNIIIEEAR